MLIFLLQVAVDSLKQRELGGKEAASYAVPRFAYSIGLGLLKGAQEPLPQDTLLLTANTEIMLKAGYPHTFVEKVDRLSRISGEYFADFGGAVAVYKLLKEIPERVTITHLIETYPALEKVLLLLPVHFITSNAGC